MQLLLVLAIVAAVSISEYAPHQPVADAGYRVLLAILATAIAPLFAVATSSWVTGSLRHGYGQNRQVLRWFGRLRSVHLLIWFGLTAFVLHEIGWVRVGSIQLATGWRVLAG